MRRSQGIVLLVVAAFFTGWSAIPSGAATAIPSSDWPQFHDGPAHAGWNQGERVLGRTNVGTLTPKWSIPATFHDSFGDPVVAGGRVFVLKYSDTQTLLALDLATGAVLWSFAVPRFLLTSPVVSGGAVYVGANHQRSSFDPCLGRVFALDAATGSQLWARAAPCPQSLTLDGEELFVEAGTDIASVSAIDGSLIWDSPANGLVTQPTVGGGLVFTSSTDGNVYAFDEGSGQNAWTAPATSSFGAFAYADGVLYLGVGPDLEALEATTGALLWTFPATVEVVSTPAAANGAVYFGDYGGNAYAVRASDGSLIWQRRFGTENEGVSDSPAIANGVVYVGADTGTLAALNSATGKPLWTYPIAPWSPTVAEGMLLIHAQPTETSSATDLDAFGLP